MTIRLLAFGIAREAIGERSFSIELPAKTTVADLRLWLSFQFPEMSRCAYYAVAVNLEYVENDIVLNENDEVAVIPPVSGG